MSFGARESASVLRHASALQPIVPKCAVSSPHHFMNQKVESILLN